MEQQSNNFSENINDKILIKHENSDCQELESCDYQTKSNF